MWVPSNSTMSWIINVESILLTTTGSQGLKAIATKNGYADWPVVSVYTKSGLPLVPWGPRNITQS